MSADSVSGTLAPVGEVLVRLTPRHLESGSAELFHKEVPLPPPGMAASAAAPVVPSLPFKYLGRWMAEGRSVVLLSHQGKELAVRVGDVVEGQYRVDEISTARIGFTYLPLKERQMLVLGEID